MKLSPSPVPGLDPGMGEGGRRPDEGLLAGMTNCPGTFSPLPSYCEATLAKERTMDNTTLLIIIIILFFVFGGGYYGRGRWY